jgi:predicted component of type VI protein secretion system
MELKLFVVSGKANKGSVTLRTPVVIGRSRQAELTVAHPMISRRHCEIFEVGGLLMIRDLGSLNGTMVEGQRIQESPLCPGNEINLGPLTFRAEYQYTGDLASVPAPKLAEETPSQPQAQSDTEGPTFVAVNQTPQSPSVDPPAAGRPPKVGHPDQAVTETVTGPDEDEAVVEIEELTEIEELAEVEELADVEDEEGDGPQPTPPPPPPLQQ